MSNLVWSPCRELLSLRSLRFRDPNFLRHSAKSVQIVSLFSTTSVCKKTIHTTKGWKTMALSGEKLDKNKIELSCEDGKGAVPHKVLMAELQNCVSVSSQIETFCTLLSMTPQDIENRKKFCQSLVDLFKPYFPNFKVHQFGSSVNGLGFKGCDVDVAIQTLFNNEDYVTLKDVPSVESVMKREVSSETVAHMTPQYLLRFIRRIFRKQCPDIKEPILLIKARCPILRFYNSKYDLFCDFSCVNESSLQNTMLLRLMCYLDKRFAILAKLIRYWGKCGGFVGDIDMFNSYAFSLLLVYFLQTRQPPVLPPLKEIIDKSDYLNHGRVDDDDLLLRDAQKFPSSRNKQSLDELLREYFFYYLTFDFSRVILPLSGTSMSQKSFLSNLNPDEEFEFGTITIQDPFRYLFNATTSASYKSCKKFLNGLVEACNSYQCKSSWIPQTNMWGICSLFHLPKAEIELHRYWKRRLHHQIELEPKLHAKDKLRNIFEYGLLFNCSSFVIDTNFNKNDNSKTIFKLHCKVYYNTWQGREWALQKLINSTYNDLELEHLISVELAQCKEENRRQMLFDFQCESTEVKEENVPKILLTLTFKESKYPPIVPIFLKEFVPYVYNKL